MFTTLQKEYALIFYIRHVLGKANNGFLHELYTEKHIREIVEALVKNKVKDQATISVEQVVDRVINRVDISALTDPTKPNAKFNILPYSPVSVMELYLGKSINNALLDMQQRVFVDDITDAKDGLAAWFISTFTRKYMVSGTFGNMVTMDRKPSISEIEEAIHSRYPNSYMFKGIDDMSELDNVLGEYATKMARNHFTHKDLNALFLYIEENFGNQLSELSLENAIDEVIEIKETEVDDVSFENERDLHEADVKDKVRSTPRIGDYFKEAAKTHFVGTMKYTRGGKAEGSETPTNVIQITLMKQDMTDSSNMDNYTTFVTLLNKLLAYESLPPIQTGTYGDRLRTVILNEEQYHALFPEYFVTVGIIKEKVSTASEMGGSTMKSGDETTNIVDRYTGEEKNENDEDDSYDSAVLTVDRTRKLMFAKMLATLDGHPESVPDQIEPTKVPNSAIYEVNRILVKELFNSPYENIQGLVAFLTTNQLPDDLKAHEDELRKLKESYLAAASTDSKASAEQNVHIKAFATILSELSKLARMDPKNMLIKRETRTVGSNKDVIITNGPNTYILNRLPTVVEEMVEYAAKGMFIDSMVLDGKNNLECALNFLENSGLLTAHGNEYTLESDTANITSTIESMNWVQLPTIHQPMMSDALRNCSWIYKHNGWERMNPQELAANDFTPIKDNTKVKDKSDYTSKFVNMIEPIQSQIRPHVAKLKSINDIIEVIRKTYNIPNLNKVEPPVVNDHTLSASDSMMGLLGTDNSAESIDKLAQGFYINGILRQYENVAQKAYKDIKEALAKNKLLNDQTRKALESRFHHLGGKVAIINEIFGNVKTASDGNIAEQRFKMDTRNIFTLAQDIVLLYNKVRADLGEANPTIASMFPKRDYIKIDELKGMTQGNTPSGKMYTEDGSACPNEFLLNAYLIDILFEAIYMLTVYLNIPDQSKYTAQDVQDMDDLSEMERYIKSNIQIKVEGNQRYSQLLSSISDRLNMLFTVQMQDNVIPVILNNPNITQLTIGAYNKINGKMAHATSEKVMSDINERQKSQVTRTKRAADTSRHFPMI